MARIDLITQTFVELADTLVDDYDPIDFLHRLAEQCTTLLGVSEAGVVLTDPSGILRVVASSSERMRAIELFEVQSRDGPCLDAWRTSAPVGVDDLRVVAEERWPVFRPAALAAGFVSVYALPLRLRATCIGALNLFGDHVDGLDEEDAILGQAMADVACIGILQERLLHEQHIVTEQLRGALNSRITIEQAKGVVAAQADIDVDSAFTLIRRHARRLNLRLTAVAAEVVAGHLDASILSELAPAHDPGVADRKRTR